MFISDSSEGLQFGDVDTKLELALDAYGGGQYVLSTFNAGVMAKAATSGYERHFDVFGRYWKSFAVLALDDNGELRENG